ncbi:MAG: hypothetical protein AB8B80_03880 [Marinicellaceae bacterium]
MHSSISNSNLNSDKNNTEKSNIEVEKVYQRPVPKLQNAGIIALIVLAILISIWEWYVRDKGVEPSYRNSNGLWAEQRRKINNGAGDGWVFTGSSRVLFNLQLDAWEKLDNRRPIQLALEGTSPVSVLEGLAADSDFTGNVIVGVAPGLFFSGYEYRKAALNQYENETPSQWLGQRISMWFEPFFSFYTYDYALSTILNRQDLPNREGITQRLDVRKLANMERDRNNRMWNKVYLDEDYNKLVKFIWAQNWKPFAEQPQPRQERIVDGRIKQIERAVNATKTLQKRGAQVVFVQMPYNGHYAISEPDIAPRELTWDRLIEQSGALGLHFQDHEEMQGYELPEWSHMTGDEADRFTANFYTLVQSELHKLE